MKKVILLNKIMKKILILLFILISSISYSQQLIIEPVKQPNLVWYFDYEPEPYIFYQEPVIIEVEPVSERDCVVATFNSQVGVREKGVNSGKEVEMYLASAGLGKGNPWCASFVSYIFQQCTDIKISSAGWVPSWFPRKKLIFKRGEINYIRTPQSGDLIGIWFANKNRLAHVGFYLEEEGDFTISVEGNTNEEGSREGDGVYRKRRITRTIHSISSWLPY
jgi:hypothetical protein